MKRCCILLSSLALWISALFTGCAGTEKEEEKKSVRIGVSLYRGDDTFINNIRGELEKCAKDYEQENGVKVNLDIQRGTTMENRKDFKEDTKREIVTEEEATEGIIHVMTRQNEDMKKQKNNIKEIPQKINRLPCEKQRKW